MSARKTKTPDPRLCCLWCHGPDDDWKALCYGDGKIRTYLPGAVGDRILGPTLITLKAVVDHLMGQPQPGGLNSCLLPVPLAKKIAGWRERDFAREWQKEQ